MNVLMLGWELPPFHSGGLGVACLGLSKALADRGINLTFLLPQRNDYDYDNFEVAFANIKYNEKLVGSYSPSVKNSYEILGSGSDYVNQALLFAERVRDMAKKYNPSIIHSHDWLTFPAGVVAKEVTGKPLIAHIHNTVFDRGAGNHNPVEYKIEKEGFEKADRVIAVSNYTKKIVEEKYGISSQKVSTVHNGIEKIRYNPKASLLTPLKEMGYKIVLYHGRITIQKGPDYFIRAAAKVVEYYPKVVFVVSGSGDMQEQMMNEAVQLGVMKNVIFAGALWREEAYQAMNAADVLVFPSISEPFGIVPLEAIANKTPTIISKQSGVSEVIQHALKVDFWDVDEMASKILATLTHGELSDVIVAESSKELPQINWEKAADKCISIYNQLI